MPENVKTIEQIIREHADKASVKEKESLISDAEFEEMCQDPIMQVIKDAFEEYGKQCVQLAAYPK